MHYMLQDVTNWTFPAGTPSLLPTTVSSAFFEIPLSPCTTPINLEAAPLPLRFDTEYGEDCLQVTCQRATAEERRDVVFSVVVPAGHGVTFTIVPEFDLSAMELRAVGAWPGEEVVECEADIDIGEIEHLCALVSQSNEHLASAVLICVGSQIFKNSGRLWLPSSSQQTYF